MKTILRLTICGLILLNASLASCQSEMVSIKGGKYIPLYGRDSMKVAIVDFLMDVYPVTNEEYLKFVKENPKWRRSKVIRLFADKRYLSSWKNDTELGENKKLKSPITNVSWFAAKNYCESQGKRLPTIDEWEYVAMANTKIPDARTIESYNKFILGWYEKTKTFDNVIGSTFNNLLESI